MLSSKSYEEFSLQNTFKAGNTHKKITLWIFTQQYSWKDLCLGKSIQGIDVNIQLSKCSA